MRGWVPRATCSCHHPQSISVGVELELVLVEDKCVVAKSWSMTAGRQSGRHSVVMDGTPSAGRVCSPGSWL